MRKLFGVAVSNAELLKWATPGRRATNRVDMKLLLENISPYTKQAAADMKTAFHAEWLEAKRIAAAHAQKYIPEQRGE